MDKFLAELEFNNCTRSNRIQVHKENHIDFNVTVNQPHISYFLQTAVAAHLTSKRLALFMAQSNLYANKGGLKPHSFHC